MSDVEIPHPHLEHLGEHLDELAGRATRAVAELRNQSQSILDDIARWKEHLDMARVDAELARMDARDELRSAQAEWEGRELRIARRLEQAHDDSAAAVQAVRAGMQEALEDLRRSIDIAARPAP